MTARTQSEIDATDAQADDGSPAISTCETSPGRLVFLESGNTDGWISSDYLVEVRS